MFTQDHEALLRSHQDMQKQVEEQKGVVEAQKKRYSDMEVCFLHDAMMAGTLHGVCVCVCVFTCVQSCMCVHIHVHVGSSQR